MSVPTAIALPGCQPSPLLSYLKALGLLRLVSEQVDSCARGRWTAQGFELASNLDRDGLQRFLAEDYRPTPIVAPWNGRSGFFTHNYDRDSEKLVTRLASTTEPRLNALRTAIGVGLRLHTDGRARGWIQPDKNGKLEVVDKDACIRYCRNRLPDAAVAWIDAVAALADGGPAYSILLGGSGGNLGSLDLTNNWYQHVAALILDDRPPRALRLLNDALEGSASEAAAKAKVGQLDPGRAGGVGRQRGDDAGGGASWVNPWDFVLALEGALLFASSIARRGGSQGSRGRGALPFTVAGSSTGAAGGADGEQVRGELWLPLWSEPATLPELARLFGEGRVQWDGRQAQTSTDAAAAIVTLGSDRGIRAFERVAVAQRLGQSSLASPVGRVAVVERPEVRHIVALDRWLRKVERELSQPPAAIASAVRGARRAQWQLTQHGGATRLADVFTAVARVEAAVGRSSSARKRIDPVQGPKAGAVVGVLADGTPEVAGALALASLRDRVLPQTANGGERPGAALHSLRACLTRATLIKRRWEWTTDRPAPIPGLGLRPTDRVLAEVLALRSQVTGDAPGDDASVVLKGVAPWFVVGWPLSVTVVSLLADGLLDWNRIADRLRGFMLLDWEYASPPTPGLGWNPGSAASVGCVVPAHRVLAPFFSPGPVDLAQMREQAKHDIRLRPEPGWARLLASDRTTEVMHAALRRLRTAGFTPAVGLHPVTPGGSRHSGARWGVLSLTAGSYGPALASALLVHMSGRAYHSALGRTVLPTDPTHEESNNVQDPRDP